MSTYKNSEFTEGAQPTPYCGCDWCERLRVRRGMASFISGCPDAPMAASGASVTHQDDGSNPKDLLGVLKLPLRYIPSPALAFLSKVMELGATKYGPFNWRKTKVKRTVYLEAAIRHILSALDGEDLDPESGQPHEAHAMACMAIVLDANATGNLIDDRFTPGVFGELVQKMQAKKATPQPVPAPPPYNEWFRLDKPGRPSWVSEDALVDFRAPWDKGSTRRLASEWAWIVGDHYEYLVPA